MSILITGGTGYIGSHTAVELLNNNEEIIVLDNFCNSSPEVVDKIKSITKKDFKFYEADILDEEKLEEIFKNNKIESVIHFAGLKAVGESVQKPLEYYYNNISGTLNLLKVMRKYNCKNIVFSSSATVYGERETPRYIEEMGRGKTTNPYGTTKAMIEKILEDVYVSDNEWKIYILRYFNPVGAHESHLIGDNPNGIPNNLMPYIQKVAVGELKELSVFGDDYNTPDGTGIRDYIHVVDLAKGHIKALEKLNKEKNGVYVYNLGSGIGHSVLEMVKTFEKVNNVKVPYKIAPRRAGDLAEIYADPTKAEKELNWKTEKTLEDMCKDSWNYIKNNK
jgi:UDP-glucose 4-epimerase